MLTHTAATFNLSRRLFCPRSQAKACSGVTPKPTRETRALPGVLGDGFGHIEGGIFAALATASQCRRGDRTCALAFRDEGGFQTRGHFDFLEPVEHQPDCQEHGRALFDPNLISTAS